jgi:hypothetical protein
MDCLYDPLLGLGVCGDWCRGIGVDNALASGRALASRIVGARLQRLDSERWSADRAGWG